MDKSGFSMMDQASGVFLSEERLLREKHLGFWPERVLTDYFDEALRRKPRALAVAAYRSDTKKETVLTYEGLHRLVRQIAIKFTSLGITRGDVVSFQLPNWWEFIAVHLACIRIGAISNPLMPIFRARELEFMLGRAESKLFIVPRTFRKFDHEALARKLLRSLPKLEHILVIDGDSEDAFETAFRIEPAGDGNTATLLRPNDIVKIMFTSGTTGEPKGVMHTSNTLLAGVGETGKRFALHAADVLFMPSPFAHSIGFLYGIMMSIMLGVPLVTMDVWDPEKAVDLIERYRISFILASTPFLSDLVNIPFLQKRNISSLRLFMTAGAPIPPLLVEQARNILNSNIVMGYGMTEITMATTTLPAMPGPGYGTDGIALPYAEVRVVDKDRKEVPRGTEGKLEYRGSTMFVGYFRRPDLYDVDKDGWFDTGDLAKMNEQGYISIVGRDKDIIIRGGENVPVVEVEKLIFEMPQVREVAVVAMPDPRLGEKGCAFVTLNPDCQLTMEDMTAFLETKHLAKQYLPERLEIINEIPKTPSGKVQKYLLREMARNLVAEGQAA
jgi:cyclohexanecarboxylate-CoA ligase